MMTISITPERQAEIDQYWAEVRAGLHKPEHHDFAQYTRDDVDNLAYRGLQLLKQANHIASKIREAAQ